MEAAMRRPRPTSLAVPLMILAAALPAAGQDELYKPSVAPATGEPEQARRLIQSPPDVAVSLFAAEPRLANPVAFSVDDQGRFYVVETFRLHEGVTDNRSHMDWLDDDLASRTVADREALHRKWLGKDVDTYAVEHDRVRRIEDRDGDGRADHDHVFADGFRDIVTGLAAGVLAHRGDVYFACIPDLWLLKDQDGDGKADARTRLSTGYGVHVSFIGHDLHGLILGPDGRLYFSIGDRGLRVVTREGKTLDCSDTGAVLRSEPDGSNLELVHVGLRNPQELAFDNFGNLFTVDNNSDSGDKARLVQIVEGGDSGWRIGYQYIERPTSRGPWNAERLWYPAPENTAAYLIPPLANLSDGPSGLAFDPGVTLLPPRFQDRFFLADFRGGAGQSGIRTFGLEPKGSSFAVIDAQKPFWSLLATDVDFAPDGALYVTDWVDGWGKTGKGRIWRFADPSRAGDKAVAEVKALLAAGMAGRKVEELTAMLAHADRRVRQSAQFELADRMTAESRPGHPPVAGEGAMARTEKVAERKIPALAGSRIARVQALWALTQFTRRVGISPGAYEDLRADPDPEIRAQAAKALGEIRPETPSYRRRLADMLAKMLDDVSPRVVLFAAQSMARLADPSSATPLLALLERNADRDAYLRHAAVFGLARTANVPALARASGSTSAAVRLGVLLALRRLDHPERATFLHDREPKIVLEAARAIYDDRPAPGPAMAALAALAKAPTADAFLLRRVVNANARLGGLDRAESLAGLAVKDDAPEAVRVEALELLGDWPKPSGRDRVTGLWRPYGARPKAEAASAVRRRLDDLLGKGKDAVRLAAVGTVGDLGIIEAVPALIAMAGDPAAGSSARVEALKAIERIGDPRLAGAVEAAVEADDPAVRGEGLRLLARANPAKAVPLLAGVLGRGGVRERQRAVAVLSDLARPEADALIAGHLRSRDLPGEVELDLLDAAARRSAAPEVKAALDAVDAGRPKDDPLAGYRPTLIGGDARRGRATFEGNTAVYCVRCHKVKGEGGEVGPELTGIGGKQSREYLAASIVHPNAAIAQGFETVVVSTADGRVVSGVLKSEDDTMLRLIGVDNKWIEVPKAEIDDRRRGPSAMPDDIAKKLSRSEIRDLVEFLATLK